MSLPAIRAFGRGLWSVLTAPVLLLVVTLATLVSVVPFGLILGSELRTAMANRQPVYLGTADIDVEWWMEFREHAEGLAATFTPAIIGFAAPLDNLSAIADGAARPIALAAPILVSALLWAVLWGGLLERFQASRSIGARAFWAAGWRHAGTFIAISLAAAVAHLVLYLTIHAVLFGPVFSWLSSLAETERSAFFWRVALYAVFGACLLVVGMTADFARISVVAGRRHGIRQAVASSAGFLRAHAASTVALYAMAGVLFVALLTIYGVAEGDGITHLGGWRSILIGQGYIVARLAIRLTLAAAGVELFSTLQGPAPVEG